MRSELLANEAQVSSLHSPGAPTSESSTANAPPAACARPAMNGKLSTMSAAASACARKIRVDPLERFTAAPVCSRVSGTPNLRIVECRFDSRKPLKLHWKYYGSKLRADFSLDLMPD
jgi:hypothetical protein